MWRRYQMDSRLLKLFIFLVSKLNTCLASVIPVLKKFPLLTLSSYWQQNVSSKCARTFLTRTALVHLISSEHAENTFLCFFHYWGKKRCFGASREINNVCLKRQNQQEGRSMIWPDSILSVFLKWKFQHSTIRHFLFVWENVFN